MADKKVHKRFVAFAVTSGLIAVGAMVVAPEVYTTMAQLVSGVFLVYCGGQSVTDWKKGPE
jgi:hypothetical protein